MTPFRCQNCQAWVYASCPHKCQPCWHASVPEKDGYLSGEEHRVFAPDASDAAEKFIEVCEEGSSYRNVVGGRERVTVLVRPFDEPDAKPLKFEVTGEYVATYYAEQIEDDADMETR